MTSQDRHIAETLKQRLLAVVPLLDIRVFGSRARGSGDECSDLDVFLKVEHLDRNLREAIFEIVWETGYEHYVVISPLIFTKDELENTPLRSSPIVKNIGEEGIPI